MLRHKIGNQRIFSTPGLKIQLGNIEGEIEEVEVDKSQVNEVLNRPEKFTVRGKRIIRKEIDTGRSP